MQRVARMIASMAFVWAFVSCGAPRGDDASSLDEQWNGKNDPLVLSDSYERSLSALPLTGNLPKTPWTDSYWPSNRGGIDNRWAGRTALFGRAVSPSLAALRTMDQAQLRGLSPAEKYDAFTGHYDYDLAKSERARTRRFEPGWHGLCHGWAPASLLFDEPKPVVLTNPDGVQIPFGSSDIKALLTYYTGQASDSPVRYLGERCSGNIRRPGVAASPECRDTNAGAFHIVLANQIGLRAQGFVADVTRGAEVWNQPISAYRSTVVGRHGPSSGAATGTIEEAEVETDMTYVEEIEPSWEAKGTQVPTKTVRYRYRLELDAQGRIIGGEWLASERPDFVWMQDKPQFKDYFSALETIYEASLRP